LSKAGRKHRSQQAPQDGHQRDLERENERLQLEIENLRK
jgi:hypothetical protein